MLRIYTKLLFISVLFFSSIVSAEAPQETPPEQPLSSEETQKTPPENPLRTQNIPSIFQKVTSPISLSIDSIFYNQDMEKKTLDNFENHFIIIHFWASWCMDCQSELIALNRLQKEFRKKALMVIVISEDFKGIPAIDKFFTKHQIDYLDIYLDKKKSIYNKLMINHLPASYLMDFDGKIIAKSTPGVPIDWDNEELKEYLEYKVSQRQLLPPEYKTVRKEYIPPKIVEPDPIPEKPKEKSKLFIN